MPDDPAKTDGIEDSPIGAFLIDPPVDPFSPVEDLRAWISELGTLTPRLPEVDAAMAEARRWLALAEQREAERRDAGA